MSKSLTHVLQWFSFSQDKRLKLFALLCSLLFVACNRHGFNPRLVNREAPEVFKARFETTKGDFEIEAHREWSPKGVDRLYQLLKSGYYKDVPIYRMVPDFVAQWGGVDTVLNNKWKQHKVPDEPVITSNTRASMSFARAGVESRGYTLFVNLKDNPRLDTVLANGVRGYPVIARITKGFEVIPAFYHYDWVKAVRPKMDTSTNHQLLFRNEFPALDRIKRAYIIKG